MNLLKKWFGKSEKVKCSGCGVRVELCRELRLCEEKSSIARADLPPACPKCRMRSLCVCNIPGTDDPIKKELNYKEKIQAFVLVTRHRSKNQTEISMALDLEKLLKENELLWNAVDASVDFKNQMVSMYSAGVGTKIYDLDDALTEVFVFRQENE